MTEISYDNLDRRCPVLGGPVTFKYCKKCGDGDTFCWKVIDCWWDTFDIMAYLKITLNADSIEKLVNARPKPKVNTLVELIEKAANQKK